MTKPTPNPERDPERSEEEPSQPRAFLPTSVIEQQMASARAAMTDLQARVESLEDRQLLAFGQSSTFLLDPEPRAPERANGRDRPEPKSERKTDAEE